MRNQEILCEYWRSVARHADPIIAVQVVPSGHGIFAPDLPTRLQTLGVAALPRRRHIIGRRLERPRNDRKVFFIIEGISIPERPLSVTKSGDDDIPLVARAHPIQTFDSFHGTVPLSASDT
jgi:hypothetical protein